MDHDRPAKRVCLQTKTTKRRGLSAAQHDNVAAPTTPAEASLCPLPAPPPPPPAGMVVKDLDTALAAVKQNGLSLQFLASPFQNNRQVVRQAIRENWHALRYASTALRSDADFMLEVVRFEGAALVYVLVQDQHHNDGGASYRQIVLEAVKQDGMNLGYASTNVRDDWEIVSEAVHQAPAALALASPRLRNNQECVWRAIAKQHHNAVADGTSTSTTGTTTSTDVLKFASTELRQNREFVRQVVRHDGLAVAFASPELLEDAEIGREAVKQNGMALDYLSKSLQANKVIVLEAVQQNGFALRVASRDLRCDPDVVRRAAAQEGDALFYYAGNDALKNDPDLMATAIRSTPGHLRLFLFHAPKLRDRIKSVVRNMERRNVSLDMDDDDGKNRNTSADFRFRHYAEHVWKRPCLEKIWMLQQKFLPNEVFEMIVQAYADIRTEIELANDLSRLAPVFAAMSDHGIHWKDDLIRML